jgi:hypothetical protein
LLIDEISHFLYGFGLEIIDGFEHPENFLVVDAAGVVVEFCAIKLNLEPILVAFRFVVGGLLELFLEAYHNVFPFAAIFP